MKIPFSPPDIGEMEIAEVVDTLRSGWITTGPKTKKFEGEIAAYCHTKKAVCLNSATACMEMTLRLFGIGPGDEVIVSAYTYTASASVICHVGAIPVLVDTSEDSFEMDYEALEHAISRRTKAIIAVDYAGVMCDYDRIFEIVERKRELFYPSGKYQECLGRILILADSAHGFGATYQGKISGEVADFTSFSFHAVKNLTTAEGGAVVWRELDGVESDEIYRQYMLLSLHGQSKDALAKTKAGAWEYDILTPAYKCNMTDIMASIGLVQLKRYAGLLKRRREIIHQYNEGITRINRELQNIIIQPLPHCKNIGGEQSVSSGHLYITRLLGADLKQRNFMIQWMAEHGVAVNVHYKPLPMLTAYQKYGFEIADFPNAQKMYENELTLPLHTKLSGEEVDYILDVLRDACIKIWK